MATIALPEQLSIPGFDGYEVNGVDVAFSGSVRLFPFSDETHNQLVHAMKFGRGVRVRLEVTDEDTGETLELDVMGGVAGKSFKRTPKRGVVETITAKLAHALAGDGDEDGGAEE